MMFGFAIILVWPCFGQVSCRTDARDGSRRGDGCCCCCCCIMALRSASVISSSGTGVPREIFVFAGTSRRELRPVSKFDESLAFRSGVDETLLKDMEVGLRSILSFRTSMRLLTLAVFMGVEKLRDPAEASSPGVSYSGSADKGVEELRNPWVVLGDRLLVLILELCLLSCIAEVLRDAFKGVSEFEVVCELCRYNVGVGLWEDCLLYTSDAADE